ncbi:hypothetical protein [Sulfitobacter sp.]|uniref:hypothetical protein n=1 Tax=Sulfitobacter sp. TaxID=1903071 RepID=UPI003001D0B0
MQIEGLTVTVNAAHGVPARPIDGSDPTILEIWDAWFDEMSRGVYRKGAYSFENEGKAKLFLKEAHTIRLTRRLIKDILGDIKVSQATGADWIRFNDTLRKLPSNHGKSSKFRHLTCLAFIDLEDEKERKRLDAALTRIARERIVGDDTWKTKTSETQISLRNRPF